MNWEKFRISSELDRSRWYAGKNAMEMSLASHVAHLRTAIRIVEDGRINKGIIEDESKLNDSRILVSWLSLNDWTNAGGSRYGSVSFNFPFQDLIYGKNYYWVESIAYGVPACRFLITSDYHEDLEPYDPIECDGPWRYITSSSKHYRNPQYCLEFMFEASVPLLEAESISFTNHSSKYCNIHRQTPNSCFEYGKRYVKIGRLFVAHLYSQNLNEYSKKFSRKKRTGEILPSASLENVLSDLFRNMAKIIDDQNVVFSASGIPSTSLSKALMQSIMHHYSIQNIDACVNLISQFGSKEDFEKTFIHELQEFFDLDQLEAFLS